MPPVIVFCYSPTKTALDQPHIDQHCQTEEPFHTSYGKVYKVKIYV